MYEVNTHSKEALWVHYDALKGYILKIGVALKVMKNNKSPGSDGITTEIYKIFWNDIKRFYIDSIDHSYQFGAFTELKQVKA